MNNKDRDLLARITQATHEPPGPNARQRLEGEFQAVLDARAEQIEAARQETPTERRQRLAQQFADAVAPALEQLPPDDTQPDEPDTFADHFARYITTQED